MSDPRDTERLRFRRLRSADTERLLELDADPEVMRYLTGGRPESREREAAVVARVLDEYEDGRPGRWLAFRSDDGEFVGWFALDSHTCGPGERELGYRLRRAAWGHGFATEGARELLRFGFAELGLARVWAQTMAVNERSRAVLSRSGLRHVRTFHPHFDDPLPGSEEGEVEYEMTRAEWVDPARGRS